MNRFWQTMTPLAYRCRGDYTYRYLRELVNQKSWPLERQREHQLSKLRRLLTHCGLNVPYYRRMFREIGFDAERVQSLDDLVRLPVLTKDVVLEHGSEMVADNMKERLLVHHTGGSTGMPMTFYRHKEYEECGFAGLLRDFVECGWSVGEPVAQFWGFGEAQVQSLRLTTMIKAWVSRIYRFNAFDVSLENVRQWHTQLKRVCPSVLFGYASTLYLFARYMREMQLSLEGVKGVFATAEPLQEFQRDMIESVLQTRVYDVYGSTEILDVACECRCGNVHMRLDSAVVEFGGEHEEAGRELIQTCLNNYAMPYIRYKNEDLAMPVDGRCPCGNEAPLMSHPMGRAFGNFTTPSGRIIHGQFFVKLVYDLAGVDAFQFHQTDMDTIVLKVVKGHGFGPEVAHGLDRAVDRVREEARGELHVDLQYVDAIPKTVRGKYLYTKSDVSPAEHPVNDSVTISDRSAVLPALPTRRAGGRQSRGTGG